MSDPRRNELDAVFERNLRGLLSRPRPFEQPAPAARARLEAAVVGRALVLAAARGQRRGAGPAPRWAPLLAAAALLLVLGFGALRLFGGGPGALGGPDDAGSTALALGSGPGAAAGGAAGGAGREPESGAASVLRAPADGAGPDAPLGDADTPNVGPASPGAGACSLRLELELPAGVASPATVEVVLLRQVPLPGVALPEFHELPLEAGVAQLSLERTGTYDVFVRTPEFSTWRERERTIGAGEELRLTVKLARGRALRGRVLDAEGRPLAGAAVLSRTDLPLAVASGGAAQALELGAPVAISGADGGFLLENVSGGALVLRAGAAGHAPGWFDVESATVEEKTGTEPAEQLELQLELQLAPEARVEGVASYADGSPASGTWVIVSINGEDQRPRYYQESVVDLEGRFRLGELPAGEGVALAFAEARSAEVPLAFRGLRLTSGATEQIEFELGPPTAGAGSNGGRVEGRLLHAGGQPVAGRAIFAMRANAAGDALDEGNWMASLTEADGSFALAELPDGPLALYASDDVSKTLLRLGLVESSAGEVVEVEYRLGAHRLEIGLTAPGSGALPVERAMLYEAAEEFGAPPGRLVAMALIDARGRAVFEELGPGPFRLDAFPASTEHAAAIRDDLRLDRDETTLELEAAAAGELRIELLDAGGRPAADVELQLVDPDGRPARLAWGPLRTDAAGVVELAGLQPGTWTVRAPDLRKSTSVFVRAGARSTARF